MAVIHVLDKHTAELIAAGEVVERPASVVKELLENAVDAGATQITVSIESGGVKLIEVTDNGSGIEAEYISTAFIRHATSKISCAADLDGIHTLGFRGEALASIASVARVEVLTRTEMDEFACCYRIEGGEELGMEPGARGVGTTIRVKDLFYNTPARMKFLKKDSSEGTFVADVVGHVALSHPEVAFRFIREGKLQYTTSGDGKLLNAAYAVLGREFSRDLLQVDYATAHYKVSGLVTPPRSCRASRSMQHFYINGRYVKNRTMMAALETAYKGTLMHGKFPGGVLMLEMPAELVDVNVHPAKTEVRFARENDIFDCVYHAVKSAVTQPSSGERMFRFEEKTESKDILQSQKNPQILAKPAVTTAAPLTSAPKPVEEKPAAPAKPVSAAVKAAEPKRSVLDDADKDILPLADEKKVVVIPANAPIQTRNVTMHSPAAILPLAGENESFLDIRPEVEEILPAEKTESKGTASPEKELKKEAGIGAEAPQVAILPKMDPQNPKTEPQQTALWVEPKTVPLQYVGEVFKTYIITQRGNEMCLIDKHAAHERILYEQLVASYGDVPQQILLAPEVVTLSAAEKQAVLENLELLNSAGLDVADFGGRSVVVRSVPSDVEPKDIEALLVELASKISSGNRNALNEKTEWVMHSIACRAAIKAGDRTAPEQLLHLAEQILSGEIPPFCPHGRPCVLKLTRKELEKQFGRIV